MPTSKVSFVHFLNFKSVLSFVESELAQKFTNAQCTDEETDEFRRNTSSTVSSPIQILIGLEDRLSVIENVATKGRERIANQP